MVIIRGENAVVNMGGRKQQLAGDILDDPVHVHIGGFNLTANEDIHQVRSILLDVISVVDVAPFQLGFVFLCFLELGNLWGYAGSCLLYTSDAADE